MNKSGIMKQAVEREGPMLPAYEEKVGLMIIIKDNEKKERRGKKKY